MKTYHLLSQLSFLKKYSYKFLFVAFIGIHIPLLGLIFYALFVDDFSTTAFIIVTLALTLGATAVTLKILNSLLKPIVLSKIALKDYVERQTIPDLPSLYTDEVGEMLKNIQFTISRLDQVYNEKQEVTELISHDLRTPVAQILQVVEVMQQNQNSTKVLDPNINLLMEIATKQLTFLDDMIRILKTEHIEIGSKNFEMLEASRLIDDIINDYKTGLEAKQLTLTNRISQNTIIYGHRQGIKQVFANLISNAIKFSRNGGKINILENIKADSVQISVQDYGIGFSEQTKKTLFNKFVPGHLGTDGEPSTGLGLYLAKSIVEKHNGNLTPVSSGPEQGATFEVSIPGKSHADSRHL